MNDQAVATKTAELSTPEEIIDLVRGAIDSGTPIVDYGVAHGGLGHAPPPTHTRLVLSGNVLEHYVGDMTVRAAAGATIEQIQQTLAAEQQFLPIDADGGLTLGEVINHNVYGPLRVTYGASRDLLLGLKYISAAGEDIHVGGRTVKNVAGYDVTRLVVGSLGQLGIIHEATLRTYAIPQHVLRCDLALASPALLDETITDWLISNAAPAGLELELTDDGWRMVAHWLGDESATAAQRRVLDTVIANVEGVTVGDDQPLSFDDYQASQAASRKWRREASAVVKLLVPPASTGAVCEQLDAWSKANASLSITALPVHGCIFAGGALSPQQTAALDAAITPMLESVAGLRMWHAMPQGAKGVAPFAPKQPDWPMLRKIKTTFDPDNLLNPGRFL